MISDKDMQKMQKEFVTKKEFQQTIDHVIEAIMSVGDMVITELRGEIIALKDEFSSILDDHEHRLDRLEDKVLS